MTSKYDQRGRLHITHEQIVVVPFLSLAEINVSISLVQQGSSVKAQYVVLRSGLHSGKHVLKYPFSELIPGAL